MPCYGFNCARSGGPGNRPLSHSGLICGVHAGNYDITHFFIDNFYKLVGDKSVKSLEEFLAWMDKFSEAEKISFVVSISADPAAMPESVCKYII